MSALLGTKLLDSNSEVGQSAATLRLRRPSFEQIQHLDGRPEVV
jgi:hypothetical protein